jgi:hypothetical protein
MYGTCNNKLSSEQQQKKKKKNWEKKYLYQRLSRI